MKIKKIALSILLIISMLMPSLAFAANGEKTEPEYGEVLYGKLLLLENMGYFEDMSELDPNAEVNRAHFAHWLAITANLTEKSAFGEITLSDVSENTEYYDDIKKVVSAGYMTGSDDNTFRPSEPITLSDAAVVLLRVAGVQHYAELAGGYPLGYDRVAQEMGIYEGVDGAKKQQNVLVMIYNTLTGGYYDVDVPGATEVSYKSKETVAAHFHNCYEIKGTITANGFTKLYSESNVVSKNSLEIDKIVYSTTKDYNDLLGMYVKGFYRYDEDKDEKIIVSVYATEKNNDVVVIDTDEMELSDSLKLTYETENGKEEHVRLARGFNFVYNNRVVMNRADTDVLIKDGQLTLVDGDNDGEYETVIAKSPETMKIAGVDMYDTTVYTDKAALSVEGPPYAKAVFKKYENGVYSDITIDEIERNSVATVYRSHDGLYLEMLICTDTLYAVPEKIGEETAVIDGLEYEFATDKARESLQLGTKAEILLDVFGRIAYVESGGVDSFQYAFLYKCWYDIDTDSAKLKLVTSTGVKTYDTSNTFKTDGVKIDAHTLPSVLSQDIIRYRLNEDEKIIAIDSANDTETYNKQTNSLKRNVAPGNIVYYPNSKSFYVDGRYKADENSFFIVVPSDPKEMTEIELYSTSYNYGIDPQSYKFALYDIDEEDLTIGAYILYPTESLKNPEPDQESPAAVVEEITTGIHEGDIVEMLVMNDNGSILTYPIDESVSKETVNSIEFGDVVRYELNAKGMIGGLKVELNADARNPEMSKVTITGNNFYRYNFGKITNMKSGHLIMETFDGTKLTIPSGDVQAYTLVDMKAKTINKMDKNNYSMYIEGASTPSYVFARVYKNYRTLDLVIYKY